MSRTKRRNCERDGNIYGRPRNSGKWNCKRSTKKLRILKNKDIWDIPNTDKFGRMV